MNKSFAMIVEIEIQENLNVDEYEFRSFMGKSEPCPIAQTIYFPEDNSPAFEVDIVGWEDTQPTQAYALSIEDSGDGEAWLIYGGKHGIRLRSTSSTKKKFSLQNKDEWGEKYLCYHRNVYDQAIEPYI